MNAQRVAWAEAAIQTYVTATKPDREDALADLLADLRHWADHNGFDFNAEDDRAQTHYNEEIGGQS